ncbi:MAG: flagellin lysine-N-methylase [Bacillota bacterium]
MYVYPDMAGQFHCRMCGTCCRRDWLVTVDEAAYNRNRRLFAAQGKLAEFNQAFQKLKGPASPGEYACISKGAAGACWFLEADSLCRLHRLAGHEHLDSVCQTYPRYPMNSSRGTEITLCFSCPAVLDLVERTAPLQFLRADETPLNVGEDFVEHIFPRQKRKTDPLFYYFEIEQHFIDLLQCRSLSLADRIVLLETTVAKISAAGGEDTLGQRLNGIFAENWRMLDGTGDFPPAAKVTAEIMTEHYLVNVVFKKIFYTYGLSTGLRILKKFHRFIRLSAAGTENNLAGARKTVAELEFRLGHQRSSLGKL